MSEDGYVFLHTIYPELFAEFKEKYKANIIVCLWEEGSPRAADWPNLGSKGDPVPTLVRAAFRAGYVSGQLAAGKTPDDLEREYKEGQAG